MKHRLLLIAEDEDNDVFFLQRALKKAGVLNPVAWVKDGQEAMDYLKGIGQFADRSRFPLPGLMLLDWKLPCITGMEVLQWLRRDGPCPTLPVIVLTSSTLTSDIRCAYSLGANSYIVKPADPERLTGLLHDFANWWLKHNVPTPQ